MNDDSDIRLGLEEILDPKDLLAVVLTASPLPLQIYERSGRSVYVSPAHTRAFGAAPPPEYNLWKDPIVERAGVLDQMRRAFEGETVTTPPIWYDPRELGIPGVEDAHPAWIGCTAIPLVRAGGVVTHVLLVFEDRTAEMMVRDEASRDRRAREALMRHIVDTAPVLISYVDRDGFYRLVNRGYEAWFGVPSAELEGKHVADLLGPFYDDVRHHIEAALGGEPRSYEARIPRRDGTRCWSWVTHTPHRDASGEVVGFVTLVQDISERKRAEEERAELTAREVAARQQAEQASRLKDEFLATLSHELRSPLNALLGWATLLLERPEDTAVMRAGLEAIARNARAQTKLVDDLLDVGRMISGKLLVHPVRTDVAAIARSAAEVVRPAAEAKEIDLVTEIASGEMVALADPDRLQQVFWNLLSNAVKFTPPRGRVAVVVRREPGSLAVEVRDTGQGIDPSFLPHVWDRFRQADSSITRVHGGLGLGLAIVRHLIELHGGTVEATSDGVGRGATFRVRLPLSLADVADAAAASSSGTRPAVADVAASLEGELTGVRVLVVDDEPDARELVTVVLERRGAEVRSAASAREAFEAVETFDPNVIVSDIGMPGEDGYSLLARIRERDRERGSHIPAAALTAYAHADDRERASAAGFDVHLAKPVAVADLIDTVATLARGSQRGASASGVGNNPANG